MDGIRVLEKGRSVKGTVGSRKTRLRKWLRSERVAKWSPFFVAESFILFLSIPMVLLIYLAFTRWRITFGPWWMGRFAGFHNFEVAFGDPRFIDALLRTLYFAAVAVPIETALGLGLAYLCDRPFKGQKILTTIFLLPLMTVPVVIGYNSNMLFIREGPINQVLSLITLSEVQFGWLSEPFTAQAAVIFSDVWQWTPLMFLIFMSGFSAIPRELVNASKIFGASALQIFWHIQLPLMRPIIVMAIVLRSMEALKIFDIPMLLTQGGPGNATETIAIYLFRVTWEHARVSSGAAMSFILFGFTIIFIFICIKILKKQRLQVIQQAGGR